MHNLSDFTKQYSLSKTLRFELKPVNPDGSRIIDSSEANDKLSIIRDIIAEDKQRANDYKKLKEILNDLHRELIEEVLSAQDILSVAEVEEAFKLYKQYKSKSGKERDKVEKEFAKLQESMRKSIAKAFKNNAFYKELFKPKDYFKIDKNESPISLRIRELYSQNKIKSACISDVEEAVGIAKSFNGFTTYLSGFNENRENMYKDEEHETAIAHRVINENMLFYFDNCIKYNKLKNEFLDLDNKIKEKHESRIFTPREFGQFLSQSGIDRYNRILGRGREKKDENDKGVNQIINEYKQRLEVDNDDKAKLKRKRRMLPKMTMLYKQILSPKDDDFAAGFKFETAKEALNSINDYYQTLVSSDNNIFKQITECLNSVFNNSDLSHSADVYLNNTSNMLSTFSNNVYSDWNTINLALQSAKNDKGKKLTDTNREKLSKTKALKLGRIYKWIGEFNAEHNSEDHISPEKVIAYFLNISPHIDAINKKYIEFAKIHNKQKLPRRPREGTKDYDIVETVKSFLDSIIDLLHFLKPLYVKSGLPDDALIEFHSEFNELYTQLEGALPIYNKIRNFVTEKPYSLDKVKLNFSNVTFLGGWDVSKETANTSIILLKDGRYYLGVMNKANNSIFNYVIEEDDSEKKRQVKKERFTRVIEKGDSVCFEKMQYALLPQPVKMLPKVFFSKKRIHEFAPSDYILNIRENKLYKNSGSKEMVDWIDFMQESCYKHKDWMKRYNFNFKSPQDYTTYFEFCNDVARQGYKVDFDKIKSSYIQEKVENGELYLFEIYNKDFSTFSKGRKNIHTMYWEGVFNSDNLKNVTIALNGGAEVFYREKSLKRSITHPKGSKMDFRSKAAREEKQNSNRTYKYDIIKDKRFTEDKAFFYCPITINFCKGDTYNSRHNLNVLEYLRNNKDVKVIGIDRGERHLLYLTLVDRNGEILAQETLNSIVNTHNGQKYKTNYKDKLSEIETRRDKERKSWSEIENIKEMKAGYLSQVVHKIAKMIIENNAIVVLEDLNAGFKNSRAKFETQVYQKFEKALIDKLNYLVEKDRKNPDEAGHYLNGYQLTAPFESFKKLGKQSGFIFYVNANNTSKIDPVTGFARLFNTRYTGKQASQSFWKAFDSICYNSDKDYFEFTFDYAQKTLKPRLKNKLNKTKWTACTIGNRRYSYDNKSKTTKCTNITKSLKELLEQHNIKYQNCSCIKGEIATQNSKDFFLRLHFLFGLLLTMRYSLKEGGKYIDSNGNENTAKSEIDFILSPIADDNGNFYDSRDYEGQEDAKLPQDADANGAYNIARKGLMLLDRLDTIDGEIQFGKIKDNKFDNFIANENWFNYSQTGTDE